MQNEDIKSLKKPVPVELRLKIYKEALNIIKENQSCFSMSSHGLCLLLPCILWDLEDYVSETPSGHDWNFLDTTKAFPEVRVWLRIIGLELGEENKNIVRRKALENIILKLEK